MDCSPPGSSVHGDSPGKNTRVGSHSLLQGIFSTQGSNPGLPHCRWILYCLSHQGSPRILELVAYPFSSGSSRPRNWTGVSCIAGEFFTSWATREVPKKPSLSYCFYSCGKFSTILQLSFQLCYYSHIKWLYFTKSMTPLFLKNIFWFLKFWLCWVFVAMHGPFLVAAHGLL